MSKVQRIMVISICVVAYVSVCLAEVPPLLYAVGNNKIEKVKELIADGVDVNERYNDRGLTAILRAASHGNTEIVKLLIEAGADPLAKDNNGTSAFYLAAASGKLETAQLLLEHGASFDKKHTTGWTPLLSAVARGSENTATWLLELGADPNVKSDSSPDTPLTHAASRGLTELVELLVQKGAEVNVVGERGHTPLHSGARRCDARIVSALLKAGAEVDPINDMGRTPLHRVAHSGHPNQATQVIDLLVEAGADINKKTKGGKTAIDLINRRLEKSKRFADQGVSKKVIEDYVNEAKAALKRVKYHTKQAAKAKRKKQGFSFFSKNPPANAPKGTEIIKPVSTTKTSRETISQENGTKKPDQSCRNKLCASFILTMVIGVILLAGIVILIVKKKG